MGAINKIKSPKIPKMGYSSIKKNSNEEDIKLEDDDQKIPI